MLVAGEDGFNSQNYGTIPGQRALLDERSGITLRGRQCVVVAHQHNVGGMKRILNLGGVEQRIVAKIGLVEFTQIFAATIRILGTDFALHSHQRMQLGGAAAGSEIGGASHWLFASLDFQSVDSLCSEFG